MVLIDSRPIVASESVKGKVVPFFEPFIATSRGFIDKTKSSIYLDNAPKWQKHIASDTPTITSDIKKPALFPWATAGAATLTL